MCTPAIRNIAAKRKAVSVKAMKAYRKEQTHFYSF